MIKIILNFAKLLQRIVEAPFFILLMLVIMLLGVFCPKAVHKLSRKLAQTAKTMAEARKKLAEEVLDEQQDTEL